MDKKLQAEFRPEIEKAYQKRAFEAFANYGYCVREYEEIAAQMKKLTDEIGENDAKVKEITEGDDFHSVVNRKKVKELNEKNAELKTKCSAYEPAVKALDEEIQKYRIQGDRYLQLARYVKDFELKEKPEEKK